MVEFSGNTIDVTIMLDKSACKVTENKIVVDVGDKIVFKNDTADTAFILFSADDLFPDVSIEIESKTEREMSVGKDIEDGEYPYAVFCMCIPGFATASAMPIIIIVRK